MTRLTAPLSRVLLTLALIATILSVGLRPAGAHAGQIHNCTACAFVPTISIYQPVGVDTSFFYVFGSGFTPGSSIQIDVYSWRLDGARVQPNSNYTYLPASWRVSSPGGGYLNTFLYVDAWEYCGLSFFGGYYPWENYGWDDTFLVTATDLATGATSSPAFVDVC